MELNLFKTTLIIVFFCLGWRIITSEGQIFYFIRKYFEDRTENKFFLTIGKPFVLCITCMASIWGSSIYLYLNNFVFFDWAICCISASFIQTFIWKLYVKLD